MSFLSLFLVSCEDNSSLHDVFHCAEETKVVKGNLMIYDYDGEISEAGNVDSGFVLCRQQNIAGTDLFCAVFPDDNYVTMHGCDVEIKLFQHQIQTFGDMDPRYNPQVAFGTKKQQKLEFVNGGVKVGLLGDAKVSALRFVDNDTLDKLWGNYIIKDLGTENQKVFALSASEGDNVVLADCPDGVQLSRDSATYFTVKVPPGAFYRGFGLDVFCGDSLISHLSTEKNINLVSGKILLMPVVEIMTDNESE